jgi:hypothetical protein
VKTKRSKSHKSNENRICALLESFLDSWDKRPAATRNPAPLNNRWSIDEQEAILDYLHGDTPTDEVKACCHYEYSRTSEILRKAQRKILRNAPQSILRKVRRKYDPKNVDDLLKSVGANIPEGLDSPRLEILLLPSYPKLPWRGLTELERKAILEHFAKPRPPLLTRIATQSFILNKRGIFDRFKQQAMADEREWRDKPGLYPAMVGDNQIKYVALPFDYSQGKDAMTKAFSRWLGSEANKKLFKKYYKKPIHKQNPDSPDRYKELLKFLATWRIYEKLGFKAARIWTTEKRRQYTDVIRLKRFFREKFREKPSKQLNKKPLYIDEREWADAIAKAKVFLATEIEQESVEGGYGLT